MKVILLEDIEKLGKKGDIVRIKDGFGRNYLIPQKKAILATDGQMKQLAELRRRRELQEKRKTQRLKDLVIKLNELHLKTTIKMGEKGAFGAITNTEICELLKEQGIILERHQIRISEPIKEPGVHDILVEVGPEFTATVKLWVTAKEVGND